MILLLVLIFVVIIGVPIVISYFIYRWLRKTEFKKYAFIFPIIILGTLIFFIYTAFYPTDSFYREDFESNTNLKLPDTAEILAKDASYPDQFGDYWSSAVIQLNEDEYLNLQLELSKSRNFAIDTTNQKIGITKEYNKLTENISENEIEIVYFNKNEQWFKVAFLKDKKRIIFERSSS
jgi:energy-coupling factor transporter transmembrane protein EcfT